MRIPVARAAPSRAIACVRSSVWKATDSSAARARCAPLVSSVSPHISPRAAGSQCGAPRPTKAGTRYTPWSSGTAAAAVAVSPALPMTLRPSRSHFTAAPAMKIEPSIA